MMNEKHKAQIQGEIASNRQAQMSGSLGVIIAYNSEMNTATVAMTENDSDEIREILENVPCPISAPGVQTVSPEPGKLCWVHFANGSINSPLIVNFYNHRFNQFEHTKQYKTAFGLPMSLMD